MASPEMVGPCTHEGRIPLPVTACYAHPSEQDVCTNRAAGGQQP
jgi:hypothetical protein